MPKKKRAHREVAVEYTEKDVLMGRGKRVGEWPGNIHFRQVINRFRDQYNRAPRSFKVGVAEKAIDAIHGVGGRYMEHKPGGGGAWIEISRTRAVEKTCQALREKEKANPPTHDPFSDANRRLKLPPSSPSRMQKRRGSNEDEEGGDDGGGDSSTETEGEDSGEASSSNGSKSSADDSEATETDDDEEGADGEDSGDDDNDKKKKARKTKAISKAAATTKAKAPSNNSNSPIDRIRNLPLEAMIHKLEAFRAEYSHCGVPPGWPRDGAFADWCTAQRQVRRETIESGYREATAGETAAIERLEGLGFVWDYADWHWRDRCDELEAVCQRKKGTTTSDDEDPTAYAPQNVANWLQDQRSQLRTGTAEVPSERVEKLRQLGIVL